MKFKNTMFGWFRKLVAVSCLVVVTQYINQQRYFIPTTKFKQVHTQTIKTKTEKLEGIKTEERGELGAIVNAVETVRNVDPSGEYQRRYITTKFKPVHTQTINTKTEKLEGIKTEDRVGLGAMINAVETVRNVDPSGEYVVVPNIAAPDIAAHDLNDTAETEVISLCTQTARNHLHYLKDLADYWRKPISVTVFTYGKDVVFALYAIAYMHTCFKNVHSTVRFHLAYPKLYPPVDLKAIYNMSLVCNNLETLQSDGMKINYDHSIPYPHNTLRNIAIQNAVTQYVLLADIDLIPSKNLAEDFAQFAQKFAQINNGTFVFIVPTFESKLVKHIMDKDTLIKEWEAKNVRRFYEISCRKCHKATKYYRWLQLPTLPYMDVGYMVNWSRTWEPFYIAKKQVVPEYDGRFKQYGYDRISHTCELYMSGFKFAVLNNGFLVHRGFKIPEAFHEEKDKENRKNAKLFAIFKNEMKLRYPDAHKNC